jgi:hypothetical protein
MRFSPIKSKSDLYEVQDEQGQLCGLISQLDDGRWKVQLYRKFVHFEPTRDRAICWARGAMTAVDTIGREMAMAAAHTRRRIAR